MRRTGASLSRQEAPVPLGAAICETPEARPRNPSERAPARPSRRLPTNDGHEGRSGRDFAAHLQQMCCKIPILTLCCVRTQGRCCRREHLHVIRVQMWWRGCMGVFLWDGDTATAARHAEDSLALATQLDDR